MCSHDLWSPFLCNDSQYLVQAHKAPQQRHAANYLPQSVLGSDRTQGITNHLSSLQSFHLLNCRKEVCICGQELGVGIIKPGFLRDYRIVGKHQVLQEKHFLDS